MDNANAALAGTWTTGTSSLDKFGSDYLFASTAAASTATYAPKIETPGLYDVYVWYPQGGNRSTNAPFLLAFNGGMMNGGERHPLQIMAILHSHYAKLARLDGVDARSERDAADAIGIKPGFPAKKALGNYQRLGGGGVKRAIGLLAAADLDLRGATDLDSEMVMEVLVARLSRLGGVSRRR